MRGANIKATTNSRLIGCRKSWLINSNRPIWKSEVSSYYEDFGFTTTGIERGVVGGYQLGARVKYKRISNALNWFRCSLPNSLMTYNYWLRVSLLFVGKCFFIDYALRPRCPADNFNLITLFAHQFKMVTKYFLHQGEYLHKYPLFI